MRVVSAAWVNELAPPANEKVAPSAVGGQPSSLVFGHTAEKVVRSYAISAANLNSLSAKNNFPAPLRQSHQPGSSPSGARDRSRSAPWKTCRLAQRAAAPCGVMPRPIRKRPLGSGSMSCPRTTASSATASLSLYLFARQGLQYVVTVSGQSIDESFARLRIVPIAARFARLHVVVIAVQARTQLGNERCGCTARRRGSPSARALRCPASPPRRRGQWSRAPAFCGQAPLSW